MRFGLALPQYGYSLPAGEPITFEACAAWARRAEELGFDSVWLSDHLLYTFSRYGAGPEPVAALEPMTTLAGIAAVTSRIRIGSLVLCAPFRHPSMLAKMSTTIDGISGGRFDLGLGAGWLEDEFAAFGFSFGDVGERFAAFEQALEVVAALQSGEPVTYDGPDVSLRHARLLPAPVHGRVPVWVGGKGGSRLLRLAARLADGWNAAWRVEPAAHAVRVAAARAACEAQGRDPVTFRFSVGLYSVAGEDENAARDAFERGRAVFPGGGLDAETWESWRADTLSGSPEQLIERVGELTALGVEEIVVSPWVLPFAVPEPEMLDLFAERVITTLSA
ncbi:MAG: LLM class flavin-dependent oxidoreductase [Actinomycetota bacterium]|nr:LLM class flavin-dependent oxidoreductase [Actinomycetota bacterium]